MKYSLIFYTKIEINSEGYETKSYTRGRSTVMYIPLTSNFKPEKNDEATFDLR